MNHQKFIFFFLLIGSCFSLIISCRPLSNKMSSTQPTFEVIKRDNSKLLSPQKITSSASLKPSKAISHHYSCIKHTIPGTDTPSENDGDYRMVILSLHEDASFELEDQKGRLKILSLQIQKGTWEIEKNNTIVLSIDSLEVHEPHQTSITRYPTVKLMTLSLHKDYIQFEDDIQLTSSNPISNEED